MNAPAASKAAADEQMIRELYPMSCAAYDCYWSARTPGEERLARLLISVARRLEGRGDTDPHTGQLLDDGGKP